jgi:rod shape-determining protein MreD
MNLNRVPIVAGTFGFLFVLQEALLNHISFLVGGFSLYLAFFIAWVMQEERNSAIVSGFIAGFIADLSPTLEAPFGLWTFVLTVISFLITNNVRAALDTELSPIIMSLVVVFGSLAALVMFLISGAILGQDVGSAQYVVRELLGNSIWAFLLSPVYAPLAVKIYRGTLTSRER